MDNQIMIFKHALSDVQSKNIGKETKIWQYSIVLERAKIGSNCNINAHCFIENDVVIGNNVTVKCGVYIWDGITIEDNVFIGHGVMFTNVLFPRATNAAGELQTEEDWEVIPTRVKKGASIGSGAVILCGNTIGPDAFIGAGAVVTRDVPGGEIWAGNPARFMKKVTTSAQS